jgi:hypothetical protein
MAEKTTLDPLRMSRPRAIEHLAPGSWWQVDIVDENGASQVWAQAKLIYNLIDQVDGSRLVKVIGIGVDDVRYVLLNLRGFGVPRTLKAAEARRCGLAVPGE